MSRALKTDGTAVPVASLAWASQLVTRHAQRCPQASYQHPIITIVSQARQRSDSETPSRSRPESKPYPEVPGGESDLEQTIEIVPVGPLHGHFFGEHQLAALWIDVKQP